MHVWGIHAHRNRGHNNSAIGRKAKIVGSAYQNDVLENRCWMDTVLRGVPKGHLYRRNVSDRNSRKCAGYSGTVLGLFDTYEQPTSVLVREGAKRFREISDSDRARLVLDVPAFRDLAKCAEVGELNLGEWLSNGEYRIFGSLGNCSSPPPDHRVTSAARQRIVSPPNPRVTTNDDGARPTRIVEHSMVSDGLSRRDRKTTNKKPSTDHDGQVRAELV